MVSFRKMSMAFAGCLLAGAIANAAPTPIRCAVAAGNAAIKLEGLTERIGDITLTCQRDAGVATDPAGALKATFYLQSDSAQFTNLLTTDTRKLVVDNEAVINPVGTDGVVIVIGAAASAVQPTLSSDGKTVTFNNIPLGATLEGAAAVVDFPITISGLKINAQQTLGVGTNPKVKVSTVTNGDPDKYFVLTDSNTEVGTVQQAVNFGTKAVATNLDCNKYSPDLTDGDGGLAEDNADGAALRKALAKVTFEGNFPGSLAIGTKLTARFKVPTGAKLYVGTSTIAATDDGAWVAAGAGNVYAKIAAKDPKAFTEIKANDDGIYEATWVVTGVDSGLDTYVVPVFITIPQNFVAAAGLTATGSIGPFSTQTTATDDADVADPRFVTPSTYSSAIVSVGSCTTTLLFPYVTNVGNWDTGIAISNPTADMKKDDGSWASGNKADADPKTGQNGTCTLYFVGDNAPAKALKSSNINAGQTVAFLVSAGSTDFGIAGVPGFNGYLKVSCTFSEGRGFAFMSSADLGGVGVGLVAERGITLVP